MISSFHSRTATWKFLTPGSRPARRVSSWKWVAKRTLAPCPRSWSASTTAQAMASPSKVDVPRPTSSRRTRLRGVTLLRIVAVSTISTRNVLWPRARLSWAPTRVGDLGERGQRVEPRQRPRGGEQLRGARGNLAPDLVEQLVLEPPPTLVGAERLGLVLLELPGHVALGARERLPADVLGRHAGG